MTIIISSFLLLLSLVKNCLVDIFIEELDLLKYNFYYCNAVSDCQCLVIKKIHCLKYMGLYVYMWIIIIYSDPERLMNDCFCLKDKGYVSHSSPWHTPYQTFHSEGILKFDMVNHGKTVTVYIIQLTYCLFLPFHWAFSCSPCYAAYFT